MSFQSLHHVLGGLDSQSGWQSQRRLQHLQASWVEVVGPAVAAQSRPWALQGTVLQVGVSSSPWVQTLMFERLRILEKLNTRLPYRVEEIRFSTTWWHRRSLQTPAELQTESSKVWEEHPSRLPENSSNAKPAAPPADPETAFQSWAQQMRSRAAQLPLCPSCRCPTPQGELERWSVCGLCAAKRW